MPKISASPNTCYLPPEVGSISPAFGNKSTAIHDAYRLNDAIFPASNRITRLTRLLAEKNLAFMKSCTGHLSELAQAQAIALSTNRLPAGAAGTREHSLMHTSQNDASVVKIAPRELQRRNQALDHEVIQKGLVTPMGTSCIYFPMTDMFGRIGVMEGFNILLEAHGNSSLYWPAKKQVNLNKAILEGEPPTEELCKTAYETALPYYAMAWQCLKSNIPLHHLGIARRLLVDLQTQRKNKPADAAQKVTSYQKFLTKNVVALIPEDKQQAFMRIWSKHVSDSGEIQHTDDTLTDARFFIKDMFTPGGDQLNDGIRKRLRDFIDQMKGKGFGPEANWIEKNIEDFESLNELILTSYNRPSLTTAGAAERKNNPKQANPLSNLEYAVKILESDEIENLNTATEKFKALFGCNAYKSVPGYTTDLEKEENANRKEDFMSNTVALFAGRVLQYLSHFPLDKVHEALLMSSAHAQADTLENLATKKIWQHRQMGLQQTLSHEVSLEDPSKNEQAIKNQIRKIITRSKRNQDVIHFLLDKASPSTGMSIVGRTSPTQAALFKDTGPGASNTIWHFLTNAEFHGMMNTKQEMMDVINTALSAVPGNLHHALDESIPIIAKYFDQNKKMEKLDPDMKDVLKRRLAMLDHDIDNNVMEMSGSRRKKIASLTTEFLSQLKSYNSNQARKSYSDASERSLRERLFGEGYLLKRNVIKQ